MNEKIDELNRKNFPILMTTFMKQHNLSARRIADAIGCSESSLDRILADVTLASDEMLREGGVLMELGFDRYSKLTGAEREQLSEIIGTISSGAIGFGSITTAVSTMGSVAGLSAAGISSGLAAIGALIGGGMAAGVVVAAAIPIAVASIGYGIVRTVKYFISKNQLDADELDPKWELSKDSCV